MTIDQQIEFYECEYKGAKTRAMALIAFGAYMALVKFRSEGSRRLMPAEISLPQQKEQA